MSETMIGLTDETLIARGRYATLRSEHRKHSREMQKAIVALNDQGRLLLQFVDQHDNLQAALNAAERRSREISEHVAELLALNEELDALRPEAWGAAKEIE